MNFLSIILALWDIFWKHCQFMIDYRPGLKIHTSINRCHYEKSTMRNGVNKSEVADDFGFLTITPVNTNNRAGFFKFLGICYEDDLDRIKRLIKKVKKKTINNSEIMWLNEHIYHLEKHPEKGRETSGAELLFSQDENGFEIIKPNNYGKERKFDFIDILRIENDKNRHSSNNLKVLYLDLSLKPHIFDVEQDVFKYY